MRKRGLKRVPQDILPWARVKVVNDDSVNIFMKKQSQWESGNRRRLQTQLLTNLYSRNLGSVILNYSAKDARELIWNEMFIFQNNLGKYRFNIFNGLTKPKNFCLFLGKGRTYNRKLFISRQSVRKLMKSGLLSGLQK